VEAWQAGRQSRATSLRATRDIQIVGIKTKLLLRQEFYFKHFFMNAVPKYFALFMSLIYLMLGAVMLADSPFFHNVSRKYTIVLGILMIVYGLFRGYRTYQKYFAGHEN
jgi:hypothetical protein